MTIRVLLLYFSPFVPFLTEIMLERNISAAITSQQLNQLFVMCSASVLTDKQF